MIKMIKPRALRPGDKVATISLSRGWPSVYARSYQDGKRQLQEAFGVQVVESRYALKDIPWLAAHPEARAADLMEVLRDPSIHGIISTIGGDDSIRMLPFLDLSVIRENPKVFLGYSDSTITHFAFLKAGVTSFYGPSIMGGFDENGGLLPYMADSVRQVLFAPAPSTWIQPNSDGWTIASGAWADEKRNEKKRPLQPCSGWKWFQGTGQHRGHLVGGCLEAVDWLRGTPIWPELSVWRNSVLFLETSEDEPSPLAVVHMLRALAATGALRESKGILFGRPFGDEAKFDAYDAALLQVLAELGLSSLPLVTRMDFGHTDPKFIIPYGVEAEIDCDRQQIRFLESPTIR
jgi:muramoyltetrapeptide carboxypeptidase LdcA involved in peptidoglycan recycling